jgi:hypothetical protein
VTLPNFLVIGAMKAGTTSMHRYLDAHPDVFMSRQKELNYFIEELNWGRGLEWYETHFAGAGAATARGETSPGYAGHPFREGVAGRIAGSLPDARLIYIVRHPVERMRSQWIHRTLNGLERRPPEVALLDDIRYLSKSRYASQVEQYLEHFPRDRLLLVQSEVMRADPAGVMRGVFEFLGVDAGWSSPVLDEVFHRTADKVDRVPRRYRVLGRLTGRAPDPRAVQLSSDLRRELEHRLRDDVEALTRFMPPTFDAWGLL